MSNLKNPFADEGAFDDKLQAAFEQNLLAALLEDVGTGDLTGKLVPEAPRATARVLVREDAVLCGAPSSVSMRLCNPFIAIQGQCAQLWQVAPLPAVGASMKFTPGMRFLIW